MTGYMVNLTHIQYERGNTMNMSETITNVTLTKACSIKADKDSTESKVINLKVKFDGATLQSVFDKAIAGTVITWQNGVGRKGFDTFKPNQTVEISFVAPASKAQIDPIDAMIASASAAGMSVEDYLRAEIAKRMSK
jgi:hypothetical protein